MGWFARRRFGSITTGAIRWFIRRYGVDMQESLIEDPSAYPSFNLFFTRALKPHARPIASQPTAVVSPVDGNISEIGRLSSDKILQAKGHFYSAANLLGGNTELARIFQNGHFLTAYLAPRNYHRIHMPIKGRLRQMIYIPGRLFSVNPKSVHSIAGLFARNERVVCLFDTDVGLMAVILVGAMIVGSISTVWHGRVTPPHQRKISVWNYSEKNISLERGAELGFFELGSTVILLFPENKIEWLTTLQANSPLRFGEMIGKMT